MLVDRGNINPNCILGRQKKVSLAVGFMMFLTDGTKIAGYRMLTSLCPPPTQLNSAVQVAA